MSIQSLSARLDKLTARTPTAPVITGFRVIATGAPRTGRTVWVKNGFRLVDDSFEKSTEQQT